MIRFGMALMEMIEQLTKGFIKSTGRQPDNLEKLKIQQEAVQRFKDMNKVVDMEGKAIDTSKGIMGGKQIKDSPEFGKKIKETYDAAKGPGKGQEMVDALKSPGAKKSYKIIEDQLGVKLYGDETFEEILKIQKTGKHPRGEPKIKIRSMIDDAIDNVSPGFVKGDRKYNAQLVAEDLAEKRFGKEFYDLDQRQQMDLYDEALDGLSEDFAQGGRAGFSNGGIDVLKLEDEAMQRALNAFKYYQSMGGKKNFRDYIKESGRFGDQFRAEGGRIGYKIGSIDKARRAFLKTVGAAGAGITALKTGLLGLGKEAAPTTEKIIDKVATSDVPPYFLNLVNKIKNLGQKFDGPKERSESFTYKDYEMDIDYDTGAIEIKKTKESMIPGGDEAGISEEVYMTYKPGMADETTKGKKVVDEYEEFTTRPDIDGKMKDVDEGVPDEVIKEGTMFEDNITEFGKASGGIARMLGE